VARHEFQPGRLVSGLFLTLAGVVYAGDAGGLWVTPWFAVIPLVVGGLCLGGAAAVTARSIRRRRRRAARATAAVTPGGGAPPGT
jgi:hypothetical protein